MSQYQPARLADAVGSVAHMLKGLGRDVRTAVISVIATSVVIGAPATAAVMSANSDRVDGKHAVGAATAVDARKGKLVATNRTNGRLPNNIIAKAPNADLLDGLDSTDLMGAQGPRGPAGVSSVRVVPIPAGSMISTRGTVLASTVLRPNRSFVVSASITATPATWSSVQCLLTQTKRATWDAMAQGEASGRVTVALEHAYPPKAGKRYLYVACKADIDTVVDDGHLYVSQVGSVVRQKQIYGAPAISPRSLKWKRTR